MAIFNRFRNQMQRPGGFGGGFGGRFSPQQLPQQNRFGGGLGGLFGGMGGYNPYQQQMPRRGGMMGRRFNPMMGGGFNPMMGRRFNPMMGGGFNPMMGGGFNPYMGGGGFNPMMGGGFNPYMGGGFQGYDFNSPIGEAPPGVEPTPPPSISDLFSGLDDDQRQSFLQQFGLAPTPTPRPDVDERDMFDSGSVPGEPGFSIEQDPGDMMVGTLGGRGYGRFPLGSAGPEFVYDDAGNPIMEPKFNTTFPPGGQIPMPPQVDPAEMDENTRRRIESGGGYLPNPEINITPPTGGGFEIPGIDLDRIRESLAKIEPIVPGISLPEVDAGPARGPGRPMPVRPPMPMPVPPINEFDNPLFSDPGLGSEGGVRPMPLPMPVKGQPKRPIKGPPPKRISDPIKVPPRTIMPVKGPRLPIKTNPPKIRPMPMPSLPIGFDPDSLFSDPGLGGEVGGPVRGPSKPIRVQPQPMPMPAIMPKIRPMPAPIVAPLPRVISDPVRPKPAPITRGIGGVRRMPVGRRR